ncbi:gamma-glutamylcyclotransferase [Sphingobium lactosutens]|uniref:gamma-glutamylcyclotransferase family protein n=1 Tax=Sphingobium lactosutens TaxID=522773 RepID=UPI0015B91564|nr:gamma-glutamylcyclotransferase family protein [Sphingobium lactosutens]NWK96820.1 gamma-glutamylcyclotransferase [Sphingobium lactosutens]
MVETFLFVYGTLRAGFDGPMARRLRREARHVGPARATGALYWVADYPGFVPEGDGRVAGDLFALDNAAATLGWLDLYEECAPSFPAPHEYRRERMAVAGPEGPVEAWVYVYARATAGLERIISGDFLSDGQSG